MRRSTWVSKQKRNNILNNANKKNNKTCKKKIRKKKRLNNKAENLIQITMCKKESRKWVQA
jgi:hypothetical protein